MPPEFQQPEYIHVLINHLPLEGMVAAGFVLLLGLCLRSIPIRMTGCLLLILAGLSFWPAEEWGEKGYDRVYAMSNTEGQRWLDTHADRAGDCAWLFYATAVMGAAALAMEWRKLRGAVWVTSLALIGSAACLGAGFWIAEAGGKVRHSEFRSGPAPVGKHALESGHEEHERH